MVSFGQKTSNMRANDEEDIRARNISPSNETGPVRLYGAIRGGQGKSSGVYLKGSYLTILTFSDNMVVTK